MGIAIGMLWVVSFNATAKGEDGRHSHRQVESGETERLKHLIDRLRLKRSLFGVNQGAFAHGEGFLFDAKPQVLHVDQHVRLELPGLKAVSAPKDLPNRSANAVAAEVHAYNPSIARAPRGLCPRCAFVVSVRVDAVHGCQREMRGSRTRTRRRVRLASRYREFHGSAIALLDANLDLLGWTWFLNAPMLQVASAATDPAVARAAGCVPPGSADAFDPPWQRPTYDARLLHFDTEHLLVTYACSGCAFSVSDLSITAKARADGRLEEMRAWARTRHAFPGLPWLAGRNQALFVHSQPRAVGSDGPTPVSTSLMVQPAMGLIGVLGEPRFVESANKVRCAMPEVEVTQSRPHRQREPPTYLDCHGDRSAMECGSAPPGASIVPQRMVGLEPMKTAALTANQSRELGRVLRASGSFGGLSLTSNLLRLSRAGGTCQAYVGIGHLHRGEGDINRRLYGRKREGSPPWAGQPGSEVTARQPFAFGYRYTHFWYALAPKPPFEVLAASPEFCLGSALDPADCESIQFISGLALAPPRRNQPSGSAEPEAESLVLSYGVNDCEARLGTLQVERVWSMLRPLRPRRKRGARDAPHLYGADDSINQPACAFDARS
jgi:hypothetical protein